MSTEICRKACEYRRSCPYDLKPIEHCGDLLFPMLDDCPNGWSTDACFGQTCRWYQDCVELFGS